MKSALEPLQEAVYSKISGDATIMALITGVYDHVEQVEESNYPYVTIDDPTSTPWRTHSRAGEELTITLHAWSQYNGKKEINDIITNLNRLFGDTDLTVSGYDVAKSWYDYAQVFRELDGLTFHGLVRYRLRMLEA